MESLQNWDAVIAKFPVLASSSDHNVNKVGFEAIYNANAGWVKPIEAMTVIKDDCERMGVNFASGPRGTVAEIVRSGDGKTVTGVRTEDDKIWSSDKVILAAGSYSDTLLDFKGQLEAVRPSGVPLS